MKKIKLAILLVILTASTIYASDSLRVASFNMAFCRHLADYEIWQARKDSLMNIVRDNNFDICAVQEPYAFQVKYLSKKAPEYALVDEPFGDETPEKLASRPKKFQDRFTILCNMNNPIWYKRDKFELLDKGKFWYSDTPEKEFTYWSDKLWDCVRHCAWAKFRHNKTKKIFYVFNTHLFVQKGDSKVSLKTTKFLRDKVNEISKGETFFIFGDFNQNEESLSLKYLINSKEMSLAKNVAKKSRVNKKDSYKGFDGKYVGTGIIDHIFVSKNVEVKYFELVEYKKSDVYPSDHLPIFADVIIK